MTTKHHNLICVAALGVLMLTTASKFGGCTYRGVAATGDKARLRMLDLSKEWREVHYFSAANMEEFYCIADRKSWEQFCDTNYMPCSAPDAVHVSQKPKLFQLKLPPYDEQSAERLLFRRSKVQGDGRHRCSWFDPEKSRVIYYELFW